MRFCRDNGQEFFMKKKIVFSFCLLLVVLTFTGCGKSDKKKSLTIFAAASTTDLMTDLALLFEKETGTAVKINPASSGTLAKQLKDGAPADVYISASKKWMDFIDSNDLVTESSDFLKNRLVLISHIDSPLDAFEMDKESMLPSLFSGRISIGDPAHVPAGQYAVEALSSLGWYDALVDRFLPAADVRAALSVVEFDEAEAGIVYATDAVRSDKVKVLSQFPEESHPPVLYFCALLKDSKPQGRAFYDFLLNEKAAEQVYRKYGFSLPRRR